MLFVYPIIVLCFNFISINCDVNVTNIERHGRRDSSRSIRLTQINNTTDQPDVVGTGKYSLETPLPNTDHLEIKTNITRVRKQKRRRPVNKTTEIVEEHTSLKSIETELKTVVINKSDKKPNLDIVSELTTPKIIESDVQKVEKSNNEKVVIRTVIVHDPNPKFKNTIEKKAVVENSDGNNNKTSGLRTGPRTFPKRPAEFNPVFKKRRERDPVVRILNEKNFVYGHNGNFHYSFEGADGTKVYSRGNLISSQQQKAGEAVVGGYFYKDDEGNDYSLSYTADENGYRPVGAHLPTPPPIPPEIARALAYLATKSTPEPVTEEYSD